MGRELELMAREIDPMAWKATPEIDPPSPSAFDSQF